MNEFLWQKFINKYSWDEPEDNYMFSFDVVSCKTTKEAKLANPNYIVLNIQRT